jgi:glucose 1-dehydrogenase
MTTTHQPTLKNQVALVTGASSGIGQAIAIAIGLGGAKVIVNYNSNEKGANETLEAIKEKGGEGIIFQTDVSKEEEVQTMFSQIAKDFGALDILVSNSGIQKDASFLEMSLSDWQKVIDINLTGQFLCAREAAREFVRKGVIKEISKAAGKIICISSIHDIVPWAGHINYATAKGGLQMMMKTMAQELAPHKIRVNSISPGAIRTPINQEVWENEDSKKELLKLIPYGRLGEPQDVAKAAVWLASDDADYVHGATLYIDGGSTLYPGFIGNG